MEEDESALLISLWVHISLWQLYSIASAEIQIIFWNIVDMKILLMELTILCSQFDNVLEGFDNVVAGLTMC